MHKIIIPLLSLLVVVYGSSCKKKDNAPANSASVLFVNGCAGTLPAVDVKVDDVNVSGALNIPFTGTSGYRFIKSGNGVNIAWYLTNVGTPVTNRSLDITSNAHYTAFAGGLVTAPSFVFVTDDMGSPGSTNAKIRFANLSPDGMSVTATVANTSIDTAVTAMEVSGFLPITAGNYELKAGDPTNINTVVTTGNKTLAAGKIYTLMLTGSLSGTGTSALKLTLISHN